MIGAFLGALSGIGFLMCVSRWRERYRPSLADRVIPHVRDLHLDGQVPVRSGSLFQELLTVLRSVARHSANALSSTDSVKDRLVRAGRHDDVEGFRSEQFLASLIGLALGVATAGVMWSLAQPRPLGLLILAMLGAPIGFVAADMRLTQAVKKREARIGEEFSVMVDLLALAVAAGESPASAMARVSRLSSGPLAAEFDHVLAHVRTGTSMVAALTELARRTGVVKLARCCEALAVALERGTPLADVLHYQAADARDDAKRMLIEQAGRKEVAMLFPIVFGILPLTIVYALWPGLAALNV